MTDTNKLKQERSGLSDLTVKLAAAIKHYGECCYDYGLGNPINLEQMNRLYALAQDAWLEVSDILEMLKAANVKLRGE